MHISAQLPISVHSERVFDYDGIRALGRALLKGYNKTTPFPHIVFDGCLSDTVIRKVCDRFPREGDREDCYEQGYTGYRTRRVNPKLCDSYIAGLFDAFNSAPMLQFLESLTGIKGLIPDPYFLRGGLLETKSGGFVEVQGDVRSHEMLKLERKVNIIIYLSEEWRDEYSGDLEIWGAGMSRCIKKVSPAYNRCVIFNTGEDVYYGHPEALRTPQDVTRRSMLVSYYASAPMPDSRMRAPYGSQSKEGLDIMGYVRKFIRG